MQKLSTLHKLLQTRSWKSIRKRLKNVAPTNPCLGCAKCLPSLTSEIKIYSNQINPEITDLLLENTIPMWPLITVRHRPNAPLFRFSNALYLCAYQRGARINHLFRPSLAKMLLLSKVFAHSCVF